MNITLFNVYFGSESLGTGLVAYDLAIALAQAGHDVRVVTSSADYGSLEPRSTPRGTDMSPHVRVTVTRIPVPYFIRIARLRRAALYGIYLLAAGPCGLRGPRPDVVLSIIPPSLAGLPAQFVAHVCGARLVLDVEDLYGGDGFRSGIAGWCNAMVERWMLRNASCIRVLTASMASHIRSIAGRDDRTRVVPVWTDHDAITPSGDGLAFRREHGLEGAFVILHSGNIGALGGQSVVLDAAERLRSDATYRFVFVGGGYGATRLREEASRRNLRNVCFLERVPRVRISDMLASGDLALSTLDSRIRQTSTPSKTFSYMAAGLPILAVLDELNAAARAVRLAGCGWIVPPGSTEALCEAIVSARDLPAATRRAIGMAGREFVQREHSKDRCTSNFVQLVESACPASS
jgi:colanic acid biosynthesis glycosyl transferase WcaI